MESKRPKKKTPPPIETIPNKRFRLDPSKITRDLVLFTFGLLGVLHETLRTDGDRQFLLMLFAGMMGLPVFLRKDEKNGDEKG